MHSTSISFERIKEWFDQQIKCVESYPSEMHRMFILLSIIDSFAQDYSQSRYQNREHFVTFTQKYSKKYSAILSAVCPVTLYYNHFSDNPNVFLQLVEGRIYDARSDAAHSEACRILAYLPEAQQQNAQMKHSYAGLTYQLRNKLSHELLVLNMPLNFQEGSDIQLPHMVYGFHLDANGKSFPHWALHIPEQFIKNVAIDAVENYLQDCAARDYLPFNHQNRKCINGWYD